MAKEEIVNEIFLNEEAIKNVPDKIIDEYEAFLKMEEIISKNLIGDIKDGEYFIPEEIKKIFVKNKKLMTKREDDFLIAKMERQGIVFKFKLVFERINGKDCLAKFYLLEDLGDKIQETFLAEFRDDYSFDFKQKARISFNIYLDEQEYKDLGEEDFKALDDAIMRNKMGKSEDRIFVEESYSEIYIIDLLKELSKGGELSKKIVNEYRELIQSKGILGAGVNHVYIKLKKILDDVVFKNGGYAELAKENPGIKLVISSYFNPIRDFDRTARKIEVITDKKEEKKVEEKKAPKKTEVKKKEEKKPAKKKDGGTKEDKPKKKEAKKEEAAKFIYPEAPRSKNKKEEKKIEKNNVIEEKKTEKIYAKEENMLNSEPKTSLRNEAFVFFNQGKENISKKEPKTMEKEL